MEGDNVANRNDAKDAVKTLLGYLENDVNREGLLDTPARVIDSWDEIFSGYTMNPEKILSSTFNSEGYDGIVLLKNIEFHSTCEHHLQPFNGKAHVAYIPIDRIVGISKLSRIVECHARRLQNQERITKHIADDLETHLAPLGCAVIIEAAHGCMRCRGVKQANATMSTSTMRGVFFDKAEPRQELFQLINN